MGDDKSRSFRSAQFVETFGHDAQGIHIQSGIRLVEDAQLGFEHGHLEYLITLLLPAAEPFVDGTVGQLAVQFHDLSLLAHHLQEISRAHRFHPVILALGIDGRTHEVDHRHTGNLHRLLEGQEESLVRPFFRFHGQQVLAVERHAATRHLVCGVSHQHITQRALSGSVLPHQGMYLPRVYRQVDTLQYLFAIDTGMQIFYL